jgi:hypothetical protein
LRRSSQEATNKEHIHICIDVQGICLKAARELVEQQQVFKSYGEFVRAAMTEYYQRFRMRQARLQALPSETGEEG